MTTNGTNGAKRKLTITKGLTIVGMVMFFVVLVFCVWSMAGGKNNEEHLAKIAVYCTTFIFGMVIAFHGKELVEKITQLILAFKGATIAVIDKVKDEPDPVD